jgi:hypothetical protein
MAWKWRPFPSLFQQFAGTRVNGMELCPCPSLIQQFAGTRVNGMELCPCPSLIQQLAGTRVNGMKRRNGAPALHYFQLLTGTRVASMET